MPGPGLSPPGNLWRSVASEGRLRVAGAQEAECTRWYMSIPSTAGAQDAERSSLCRGSLSGPVEHAHYREDHEDEQDQEDHEQDLRQGCGDTLDAGETQTARNQRDDGADDAPPQQMTHDTPLVGTSRWTHTDCELPMCRAGVRARHPALCSSGSRVWAGGVRSRKPRPWQYGITCTPLARCSSRMESRNSTIFVQCTLGR